MATQTITTIADNSTDGNFRAWVAGFINAIIATGWAQTGDSGQFNAGTTLKPSAANQPSWTYAVFSRTDSVGTMVIRVDFGSGNVQAAPAISFTVGETTDGAGNVTGVGKSTIKTAGCISGQGATTFTTRMCGVAGVLVINAFLENTSTNNVLLLYVERSRAADGSFNTDGWIMVWGQENGHSSQAIPRALASTASAPIVGGISVVLPNQNSYTFTGSPVIQMMIVFSTFAFGAGIGLALGCQGDFPVDATASVEVYGVAHTYIGQPTQRNTQGNSNSTNWRWLLLWE